MNGSAPHLGVGLHCLSHSLFINGQHLSDGVIDALDALRVLCGDVNLIGVSLAQQAESLAHGLTGFDGFIIRLLGRFCLRLAGLQLTTLNALEDVVGRLKACTTDGLAKVGEEVLQLLVQG